MEGSNLVLATITDHEYRLRPRASRAECGAASGAAEFGDVAGAAARGLVWTRRWRGAVSGVSWQFRIVGSVQFPLVTGFKFLRTPSKSGL